MFNFVVSVLKVLVVIISVLISVALMTVMERKYLSGIQRRKGPNVVGFYGLTQAVADGLKLIVKDIVRPTNADSIIFVGSPLLSFLVSLMTWSVIPVTEGIVLIDMELGLMLILVLSAIGVYGVLFAGYSSNSKYGFFGSIRSTSQMISYEVSIGFLIASVLMFNAGTISLNGMIVFQEGLWSVFGLLPVFGLFVISIVAETNRHPFDLPEAESELVSGYNVEYSSGSFALFFLAEYSSIIMMSALTVVMFLSDSLGIVFFSVKVFLIVCLFVWLRSAFPRYRYDQLISLGYKDILSLSVGYLVFISSLVWY